MKLLILFGPPAVGKFTVGKLIEGQTDFKLFHNHAIMDGVMHIFGKGTRSEDKLSRLIRESVIKEAADSNIDLIFTYVWNFSIDKGKHNIDAYKQLYEERGGTVYFVELVAPLAIRSQRAANPDRFDGKSNTAGVDEVKSLENSKKFTSPSPFYYPDQYLQIDASDKAPHEITKLILAYMHV